jgi:putative aldouronate transport system substrate-binding protein
MKNAPALDSMQAYADVKEGKEAQSSAQIRATADFETAPDMAEGYALANAHRDELLPNLFNGEPTATMKKKWEQLQTMEKQVYTNIIYGKETLEAFDKFVQDWKAQGGDEITKEINEWYQAVK